MAKFEGNVEGFRTTPGSSLDTNSIVKDGALIGVTRKNLAASEAGIAYMGFTGSHYTLPLATTAVAAVDRGTLVKDNGAGKIAVAAAGDTVIGCLYSPIASGDTEADVLLATIAVPNGAPVAANVAAASAVGDPADTNYTTSELKTALNAAVTKINAILTAMKAAGLMTADSTP